MYRKSIQSVEDLTDLYLVTSSDRFEDVRDEEKGICWSKQFWLYPTRVVHPRKSDDLWPLEVEHPAVDSLTRLWGHRDCKFERCLNLKNQFDN